MEDEGWRMATNLFSVHLPLSSIFVRDMTKSFSIILALLIPLLTGCGENTAVSHGHNTALDSANLIEMTEQMTGSIMADPKVQSELNQRGKLKIVIQPVENR